jgi:hypothetical protein
MTTAPDTTAEPATETCPACASEVPAGRIEQVKAERDARTEERRARVRERMAERIAELPPLLTPPDAATSRQREHQ